MLCLRKEFHQILHQIFFQTISRPNSVSPVNLGLIGIGNVVQTDGQVVVWRSVTETKDDTEGIDTQHLQTLEKLKQTQRLEHQKV